MEDAKQDFRDFIEEYGVLGIDAICEKLYRVHRGNLSNMLRTLREQLDKIKYGEIKK